MIPKVPGHGVVNVIADQTAQAALARQKLDQTMNPFADMVNPLAFMNPFIGFAALASAMAQQQTQPTGIKTFTTVYSNGDTPKVQCRGEFDIDEWMLVGQNLLEQINDPQRYGQLQQQISNLLDGLDPQQISPYPSGTIRGNAQQRQGA